MACPICDRDPDPTYRPFCSKRCADVDLGKWMTGAYAVPVEQGEDWDEDTHPARPEAPGRPH